MCEAGKPRVGFRLDVLDPATARASRGSFFSRPFLTSLLTVRIECPRLGRRFHNVASAKARRCGNAGDCCNLFRRSLLRRARQR